MKPSGKKSTINVMLAFQADNQSLSQASKQVGNQLTQLQRKSALAANKMTSFVPAFAAVGGAAFSAFNFASRAAIQFQDSFAGVKKTLDFAGAAGRNQEANFKALAKSLVDMSGKIPVAATELSKIAEIGGQLGIEAVNIAKFTETIAKLTVATNMGAEEGAFALSRLAAITRVPEQQIENLASVVVRLGNEFAATESEIVGAAQKIAAAMELLESPTSNAAADSLALAAALKQVGQQTQAGSTAVARALDKMSTAVIQGGRELSIFAKVAGMTSEEFRQLAEISPAQAFVGFLTGLRGVGAAGGDTVRLLEELGLGQQRTLRALRSMALASDDVKDALNSANEEFTLNNALQTEAEKRYETITSQIGILRNNVNALAIDLGNDLLPLLNKVVGGFTTITAGLKTGEITEFGKRAALAAFAANAIFNGFKRTQATLEEMQKIGVPGTGVDGRVRIFGDMFKSTRQRASEMRAFRKQDKVYETMNRKNFLSLAAGEGVRTEGLQNILTEADALLGKNQIFDTKANADMMKKLQSEKGGVDNVDKLNDVEQTRFKIIAAIKQELEAQGLVTTLTDEQNATLQRQEQILKNIVDLEAKRNALIAGAKDINKLTEMDRESLSSDIKDTLVESTLFSDDHSKYTKQRINTALDDIGAASVGTSPFIEDEGVQSYLNDIVDMKQLGEQADSMGITVGHFDDDNFDIQAVTGAVEAASLEVNNFAENLKKIDAESEVFAGITEDTMVTNKAVFDAASEVERLEKKLKGFKETKDREDEKKKGETKTGSSRELFLKEPLMSDAEAKKLKENTEKTKNALKEKRLELDRLTQAQEKSDETYKNSASSMNSYRQNLDKSIENLRKLENAGLNVAALGIDIKELEETSDKLEQQIGRTTGTVDEKGNSIDKLNKKINDNKKELREVTAITSTYNLQKELAINLTKEDIATTQASIVEVNKHIRALDGEYLRLQNKIKALKQLKNPTAQQIKELNKTEMALQDLNYSQNIEDLQRQKKALKEQKAVMEEAAKQTANYKNKTNSLTQAWMALFGVDFDRFTGFIDKMMTKIGNFLTKLGDLVIKLVKPLFKLLDFFFEKLTNMVMKLFNVIGKFVMWFGQKMEKLFWKTLDGIKWLGQKSMAILMKLGNYLINVFKRMGAVIAKWAIAAKDVFLDMVNAVRKFFKPLTDVIIKSFNKAKEAVTQFATNAMQRIKQSFQINKQIFKEFVDETKAAFAQLSKIIKDAYARARQTVVTEVMKIVTRVKQSLEINKQLFLELVEETKQAYNQMKGAIIKAFQQVKNAVMPYINAIVKRIKTSFQINKEIFGEFVKETKQIFKDLGNVVNKVFQQIKNSRFVKGITSQIDDLKNRFKISSIMMKNSWKGFTEGVKNSDFVKGFNDNMKAIKKTVKDVMDNVGKWTTTRLGAATGVITGWATNLKMRAGDSLNSAKVKTLEWFSSLKITEKAIKQVDAASKRLHKTLKLDKRGKQENTMVTKIFAFATNMLGKAFKFVFNVTTSLIKAFFMKRKTLLRMNRAIQEASMRSKSFKLAVAGLTAVVNGLKTAVMGLITMFIQMFAMTAIFSFFFKISEEAKKTAAAIKTIRDEIDALNDTQRELDFSEIRGDLLYEELEKQKNMKRPNQEIIKVLEQEIKNYEKAKNQVETEIAEQLQSIGETALFETTAQGQNPEERIEKLMDFLGLGGLQREDFKDALFEGIGLSLSDFNIESETEILDNVFEQVNEVVMDKTNMFSEGMFNQVRQIAQNQGKSLEGFLFGFEQNVDFGLLDNKIGAIVSEIETGEKQIDQVEEFFGGFGSGGFLKAAGIIFQENANGYMDIVQKTGESLKMVNGNMTMVGEYKKLAEMDMQSYINMFTMDASGNQLGSKEIVRNQEAFVATLVTGSTVLNQLRGNTNKTITADIKANNQITTFGKAQNEVLLSRIRFLKMQNALQQDINFTTMSRKDIIQTVTNAEAVLRDKQMEEAKQSVEALGIMEYQLSQFERALNESLGKAATGAVSVFSDLPGQIRKSIRSIVEEMTIKEAQMKHFDTQVRRLAQVAPMLAKEIADQGIAARGMLEDFLMDPAATAAVEASLNRARVKDAADLGLTEEEIAKAQESGLIIGDSTAEGIIIGIQNRKAELQTVLVSAMDGALEAVKAFNEQNSPSKLWRDQVGTSIMEGITEGVTDNEGYFEDEIINAVDNALNKAKEKVENETVIIDPDIVHDEPTNNIPSLDILGEDPGDWIVQEVKEVSNSITDFINETGYFDGGEYYKQFSEGLEDEQSAVLAVVEETAGEMGKLMLETWKNAASSLGEALNKMFAVTGGLRDIHAATYAVQKAEQALAAERRKQATFYERKLKNQIELQKLELEGRKNNITTTEQLSILQKKVRLEQMKKELKGEFSASKRKQIVQAEEELERVRLAAQAGIATSLDVEVAEEKLAELKGTNKTLDEQTIAILEVTEAEKDLEETKKKAKEVDEALIAAREERIQLLDEEANMTHEMTKAYDDLEAAVENTYLTDLKYEEARKEFRDFAESSPELFQILVDEYGGVGSAIDGTIQKTKNLADNVETSMGRAITAVREFVTEYMISQAIIGDDSAYDSLGNTTREDYSGSETVRKAINARGSVDELLTKAGLGDSELADIIKKQIADPSTRFELDKNKGLSADRSLFSSSEDYLASVRGFKNIKSGKGNTRDLANFLQYAYGINTSIDESGKLIINSGQLKSKLEDKNSTLGSATNTSYEDFVGDMTQVDEYGTMTNTKTTVVNSSGDYMSDSGDLARTMEGESGPLHDYKSSTLPYARSYSLSNPTELESILRNIGRNESTLIEKLKKVVGNEYNNMPIESVYPKYQSGWGRGENEFYGFLLNKIGGEIDKLHNKGEMDKYSVVLKRKYGGNVKPFQRALVGEYGPEFVTAMPGGGLRVTPQGSERGGSINVANLNVNVTGVPTDPIQARKAAVQIQSALKKLEKEGNYGTGLSRR